MTPTLDPDPTQFFFLAPRSPPPLEGQNFFKNSLTQRTYQTGKRGALIILRYVCRGGVPRADPPPLSQPSKVLQHAWCLYSNGMPPLHVISFCHGSWV